MWRKLLSKTAESGSFCIAQGPTHKCHRGVHLHGLHGWSRVTPPFTGWKWGAVVCVSLGWSAAEPGRSSIFIKFWISGCFSSPTAGGVAARSRALSLRRKAPSSPGCIPRWVPPCSRKAGLQKGFAQRKAFLCCSHVSTDFTDGARQVIFLSCK